MLSQTFLQSLFNSVLKQPTLSRAMDSSANSTKNNYVICNAGDVNIRLSEAFTLFVAVRRILFQQLHEENIYRLIFG
jgi:hypothetical protein